MPDLFKQRLDLAQKIFAERRFNEAIVLFNWLCEMYPGNAASLLDSARVNACMYDYEAVNARLASLEALEGLPAETWIAMSHVGQLLRRPEWAERFLSNSVSKCAPTALACGMFAQFMERGNELERAASLVEDGLKIAPLDPTCLLVKARVLRRQKNPDAADAVLRTLLASTSAGVQNQMAALYELAKLNDERGDYGGAMAALGKAKQIAVSLPSYPATVQRAMVTERIQIGFLTSLTADYFRMAQWSPLRSRNLALLAGHPRSGTTLLEQVLDSHSQIASAEETAVYDLAVNSEFAREVGAGSPTETALRLKAPQLERMRESYFQKLQAVLGRPDPGMLIMDKNPSWTNYIPVYARFFPEARFVIALRDPRDVVLSVFFQDLPVNESTVRFQSLKDTAARYANTMSMWRICREHLDPQKWVEVRYESLVQDLAGESEKVMRMLNLQLEPDQLKPEAHAKEKNVQSPSYAEAAKPVHSQAVGKWKRYQRWLDETIPTLAPLMEAFGYQ